ncbi:hypothetical protein DFJ43DRAFT_1043491 [Lentinula guzmanii]|uniref:Uncharacterized protein n=1 Tax=Lentinula guzmanii TaxID=2804957 RepID=A0AA38MQY5_9AGAR|nr:hypothetical protein DFJ43DRAFT_1043491 [Lentinula guzmanii]
MGPTFNQLVQVNYDEVTFSDGTKSISERQNASNADLTSNNSGSGTPLPTKFERAHIFMGVWSPSSHTPIWWANELITPWPENDNNSNNANINTSLPNSEPVINYWILEPKLLGTAIWVNIQGGTYDTVEKRKKNGTFVKTVLESDNIVPLVVDIGGQQCLVSVTSILKFHKWPKPSTKRALMIVIEGPHTGKFVRQLYHFFQMSKAPENAKFIAAMTDRSMDVEFVTREILDLDRDEVELVEESASECRTNQPEILNASAKMLNYGLV